MHSSYSALPMWTSALLSQRALNSLSRSRSQDSSTRAASAVSWATTGTVRSPRSAWGTFKPAATAHWLILPEYLRCNTREILDALSLKSARLASTAISSLTAHSDQRVALIRHSMDRLNLTIWVCRRSSRMLQVFHAQWCFIISRKKNWRCKWAALT